MANDICLKLINLLEKNNEEYTDEFPIYIENATNIRFFIIDNLSTFFFSSIQSPTNLL
mgnify:CR=1 FL=1